MLALTYRISRIILQTVVEVPREQFDTQEKAEIKATIAVLAGILTGIAVVAIGSTDFSETLRSHSPKDAAIGIGEVAAGVAVGLTFFKEARRQRNIALMNSNDL